MDLFSFVNIGLKYWCNTDVLKVVQATRNPEDSTQYNLQVVKKSMGFRTIGMLA